MTSITPATRTDWLPTACSMGVLAAWIVYAVVRYDGFVVSDRAHPNASVLFIVNKALAAAATTCLAGAVWGWRGPTGSARRVAFGWWALGLGTVHAVIAVMVAALGAYQNALPLETWHVQLSILIGAVAWVVLLACAVQAVLATQPGLLGQARPWLRWLPFWALIAVLAHSALLKPAGFISPGNWAHSLPPITLLSCFVAAIGIVAWVVRRVHGPGDRGAPTEIA